MFKYFNLLLLFTTATVYSQDTTKVIPDGTEGLLYEVNTESRTLTNPKPNDFDGQFSTFRIGMGFIYDVSGYSLDETFKEQMELAAVEMESKAKVRDFRLLGSGVFKTKRSLAFKFAYMWDGSKDTWLMRESGFTIGVPELFGHIFIGRTKEGYSLVKVMNGHSPWTNERLIAIDPIPILADGIKWFGHLPKSRIFWNLGYFNDLTSEGHSFSTYEWQGVARVGFLPVYKDKVEVLHVAANLRYGKPLNNKMTLRSRPESNPAPYVINTGEFATDESSNIGLELYYRRKKLTVGTEIHSHHYYNEETSTRHFYGGDIFASYMFSNAVRPYNQTGSIFGFVPVEKSVTKGGWGTVEGVLRFSIFNLNDGPIKGGQFWRITPMVNWYLTKTLRMELIYGYGQLDRFDKIGNAHFFETRFQLTVM